jgi:hypothetical protein
MLMFTAHMSYPRMPARQYFRFAGNFQLHAKFAGALIQGTLDLTPVITLFPSEFPVAYAPMPIMVVAVFYTLQ